MNKELSNKITNLSFYMTIVIVLLHSNCMSYANVNYKYYDICLIVQNIVKIFCCIAVPNFFAISSYLFFRNFDYSKYISKLKTRFSSLFIPYLFWSTLFLIYMMIITNLKFVSSMDSVAEPTHYNLISIIKNILFATYDGPLWYVLVLIFFVIISPIIYFLIKKLGKLNIILIVVMIMINLTFCPSYNGPIYWMPINYSVAYLTINYKEKLEFNTIKISSVKYFALVVYMILFTLTVTFSTSFHINFLYEMFCPIIVFLFFYSNKRLCKKPVKIAKNGFFVFCIHSPIAVIVKRVLIIFLGNNPIVLLFLQFIVCVITLSIIFIMIKILIKWFPNFFRIISGNRI